MTIEKLELKSLSRGQFEQIAAIEAGCGLEPYTPGMLLECITHMDTFACMDGGDVVGFITIHPSTRYLGRSLYIVNLNVAKDYRRRGIAKNLIRTACAAYGASHANRYVTLDVTKNNRAAMELYKQLGFQVTHLPSQNGGTDVVMAIPLEQLIEVSTQ